MKHSITGFLGTATFIMTLTMGAACAPPGSPLSNVEQTILTDLKNGVALKMIEAAVATLIPGGADVDTVINDVITLLHDDGLLPPDILPKAQAIQSDILAKKATAK